MAEVIAHPAMPAPNTIMGSLLRKLNNVRPESDGWVSDCPSPDHDGRNVRLYVWEGSGGDPEALCDEGCESDVLADVLFPAPPPAKAAEYAPKNDLEQRIIQLSVPGLRVVPPPRQYLLHDANTGQGRFVAGKVGILASPGGSGKSWALAQLAVAVATGTTWFGPCGWAPAAPGRVLLLAGEEDRDELDRRIYYAARAQGVTSDDDLQLLAQNLDAIPLAGVNCALTHEDGTTRFLSEVLDRATQGYALVILDPLARFSGPDVETDNAAATRWVQVVESIAIEARASVMVAHHTKKAGENTDPESADLIRGASGLVNGVRWAARLEQQKRSEDAPDLLTLRIVKANGVAPMLGPLVLCRDQGHEGALRVATHAEEEAHEGVAKMVRARVQKLGSHRERVIAAMLPGKLYGRNELARICGNKGATLEAIAELLAEGVIQTSGSSRYAPVMVASEPPEPMSEPIAESPPSQSVPHTPHPPKGGGVGTDGGRGPGNHAQAGNREPIPGTDGEGNRLGV